MSTSSAGKPASPHARFIPREELRSFAAWSPGAFASGTSATDPRKAAVPGSDEARDALHAARQAGYQDGYRDGLVALEAFKQSFATQSTERVGQLLKSIEQQWNGLEEKMAQALAQAATALARQVVRTELTTQPQLVAAVAREALASLLLSARHVTLQVHPDDLPLVQQGAGEELARRDARLVANAQIARGGCLVESDIGRIDADIERRWQRAAGALGDESALGAAEGGTA